MAQFTRVSGDFQPVMHFDAPDYTNNGVNAVVSGATVQPQGPKLDFFTVTFDGSLSAAEIAQAFQTVQQLATVHMYEYTVASDDTLALAVYPVGGWSTTTLDAAFTDAGITGTSSATGATFNG